MTDITLILTDAGAAALAAAAMPAGDPVNLVEMGLTAADFVAAPTLIALPGEFKRIPISGTGVDAARLHLTGEDASPDSWTARGLGLYTSTGILFAAYHHVDAPNDNVMMVKASPATALIPVVILMQAAQAALVTFENVNLIYPPASEADAGVMRIASQARVDDPAFVAGDEGLAVSVKTFRTRFAGFKTQVETILASFSPDLAAYQAALNAALSAITGRTITGTGLATGGGSLEDSRAINVAAATEAETVALTITDKAVTPGGLVTLVTNILAGITNLSNTIFARRIDTEGLLTGGGDFAANRTHGVAKASQAEILAFLNVNKAVTPDLLAHLFSLPAASGTQTVARIGPFLLKRVDGVLAGFERKLVNFTDPFPNAIFFCVCSASMSGNNTEGFIGTLPSSWTPDGVAVSNGHVGTHPFSILALGY